MNLKENTERVFQQIKDASQQSGRETNSVSVVAVTKYVDVPTAEALLPLGVHHIGENRVDKFLEKYEALKLAEEIQKRSDRVVKCFLQVNISREESKHGFSREELLEFLPELATLDKIEYVGLMTMAPFEASSDELKEIFKATQDLQLEIREKQIPNMPMTDLSMGMSRDYKEAIEFGSTFVRIGTAFFK